MKRINILVRVGFSYLLFLLLGILFPMHVVSESSVTSNQGRYVLSFLIVIMSLFALIAQIMRSGKFYPLSITFWIFSLLWLGLSSLVQIVFNEFNWPGNYSTQIIIRAQIVVLIGFLGFFIGSFLGKNIFNKVNANFWQLGNKIYFSRLVALIFLSYSLSIFLFGRIGDFSFIFTGRVLASKSIFGSGVMIGLLTKSFLQVPSFISLTISLQVFIALISIGKEMARNRNVKLFSLILLFLSIMLFSITNFPLYLSRYWLGTIVISIMFIFITRIHRGSLFWIIFWIFAVAVFYPLLSRIRYITNVADLSSEVNLYPIVDYLRSGDFDAFQQIMNTIIYTDLHGFGKGRNFLGASFFFIPRSMWQSKPMGTGMVVAESLGYSFTNLSCPLWAEAFYSLGYIGVFIVLMVYGMLLSFIDHAYNRYGGSNYLLSLLVAFYMPYQIFFLRGDLINGIAYMSLPVILYLCFFLMPKIVYRIKKT